MLAVEPRASQIFCAHNPLKRSNVQLAKRVVLIARQALSFSVVFDRIGRDIHNLTADKRLDPFNSIPSGKP
jgi:hypothetical protein